MEPNIAQLGALIGDPARAKMLMALMGGKALTASELATEAEITAQTASSHLNKLLESKILIVLKQGRHKYFSLQGPEVAALLEGMLNLSAQIAGPKARTGPSDPHLRQARVCYDHLAGEMGVQLFHALESQALIQSQDQQLILSATGLAFFTRLGMKWEAVSGARPLCRSCLDWSERKTHLAGYLGSWILKDLYQMGWAKKDQDSRAIHFSSSGLKQFQKRYGCIG